MQHNGEKYMIVLAEFGTVLTRTIDCNNWSLFFTCNMQYKIKWVIDVLSGVETILRATGPKVQVLVI